MDNTLKVRFTSSAPLTAARVSYNNGSTFSPISVTLVNGQYEGTLGGVPAGVYPQSTLKVYPEGYPAGVISGTGTDVTITGAAVSAPTISGASPNSGAVGSATTINGTNFTGATAVRFNGTAATFTVLSATSINATVPAGATTGIVAVTTPSGTATSTGSFTVSASSGGATAYPLSAADMSYNAYPSAGSGVRSSFAEAKFSGVPGGSSVTVAWEAPVFALSPECAHITVWDENSGGAERLCLQDLASTGSGTNTATFTLPGSSSTLYALAFVDGGQQRVDDAGTVSDCRITSVTLVGTKLAPQRQATGYYFLVDSIGNAVKASSAQFGWVLVARKKKRPYDLIIDGWGFGSFAKALAQPTDRQEQSNRVNAVGTGYTSFGFGTMRGTNDYGLFTPPATPTSSAAIVSDLFPRITTANRFFIQPLPRSSESAIGGYALPDFRSAFAASAAASARVVDSSAWTDITYVDGLHPNDAGYAALEGRVNGSILDNYTTIEEKAVAVTGTWTAAPGVGPTVSTDGDTIYSTTPGSTATSSAHLSTRWQFWGNRAGGAGMGRVEVLRSSDNVVVDSVDLSFDGATTPPFPMWDSAILPSAMYYARLTCLGTGGSGGLQYAVAVDAFRYA
jgi:hypothetical protein